MDSSSIQALFAGLTFTRDALRTVLTAKIDADSMKAISEALEKLESAQSTIYQMREEMFELQTVKHDLESKLIEFQKWQETLDGYELVKTIAGDFVYKSSSDPIHFACPRCIEDKSLHILQVRGAASGHASCSNCKNSYKVQNSSYKSTPTIKGHW